MTQLSRIRVSVLILLSVFLIYSCAKNESEDLTDSERQKLETEVSKAVDLLTTNFAVADTSELNKIVAEEYWHNNSNGSRPSREQWLNWLSGRMDKLESGELTIEKFYNDEVIVKILARNIAIVNGINISIGVNDGEPFNNAVRFSHVWVKENNRWKRRMFHDSRIEDYFSN